MKSNKATKRHVVEDQTKAVTETTAVINNEEITNQGKVIEITPEEFIQREETSTTKIPVVETEEQGSGVATSSKPLKKFEFPKTKEHQENRFKEKGKAQNLIEKGKQTISNFDKEEALAKAKKASSKLFKNIQKSIRQLRNRK
ncbi:MAG: hypothetical protein QM613_02345 [Micrococcaceae bacterium]